MRLRWHMYMKLCGICKEVFTNLGAAADPSHALYHISMPNNQDANMNSSGCLQDDNRYRHPSSRVHNHISSSSHFAPKKACEYEVTVKSVEDA